MTRQMSDLETLLQHLIAEHRKLIDAMNEQQSAMKRLNLPEMEAAMAEQESLRLRIGSLDLRRRSLVQQVALAMKLAGEPSLQRIASADKQRGPALLKLRDELREVMLEAQSRTHIVGKLAGAVLGHLNTVVRAIAGTVEQAGVYNRSGLPQMSARIGAMEAVG